MYQDWFGDDEEEISLLLDEKRMQNMNKPANRTVAAHFQAVKATVPKKLRMMQKH